MTMHPQAQRNQLYYALIIMAILSTFYLLSVFGLFSMYPHFVGETHLHKWHTLFRLCFVIAFAVVNHWFLVPHFYIKKRYLLFFCIIFLCLVSILVLPDIIIKVPIPEPPNHRDPKLYPPNFKGSPPPPFLKTLLIELAHMYLLFFISTFTSIAFRTRQYMQQIEQQQASTVAVIEQQQEAIVEKQTEIALTVTVNYSLIRIEFSDILFIKSMDNYLQFHLKEKKPILVRMTLKEAIEKLPNEAFLRVHKSYIVSIAAIESIRNKNILIAKQEIPIGRAYEGSISKVF